MNSWPVIRAEYAAWLRALQMLANIGQPGEDPEVIGPTDEPVMLDVPFWSNRTHEAEAQALRPLTDPQIDDIIEGWRPSSMRTCCGSNP